MPKPKDTYNLEDFIEAGENVNISYNKLSMIDSYSGIDYPAINVINDYMNELKLVTVTVTFSDDEYRKYKYKPKLLAHDIYGNPELYFIILLINNIYSVKDFSRKKIKMISKSNMADLMTYIYNAEKKSLDEYNNKNRG